MVNIWIIYWLCTMHLWIACSMVIEIYPIGLRGRSFFHDIAKMAFLLHATWTRQSLSHHSLQCMRLPLFLKLLLCLLHSRGLVVHDGRLASRGDPGILTFLNAESSAQTLKSTANANDPPASFQPSPSKGSDAVLIRATQGETFEQNSSNAESWVKLKTNPLIARSAVTASSIYG